MAQSSDQSSSPHESLKMGCNGNICSKMQSKPEPSSEPMPVPSFHICVIEQLIVTKNLFAQKETHLKGGITAHLTFPPAQLGFAGFLLFQKHVKAYLTRGNSGTKEMSMFPSICQVGVPSAPCSIVYTTGNKDSFEPLSTSLKTMVCLQP